MWPYALSTFLEQNLSTVIESCQKCLEVILITAQCKFLASTSREYSLETCCKCSVLSVKRILAPFSQFPTSLQLNAFIKTWASLPSNSYTSGIFYSSFNLEFRISPNVEFSFNSLGICIFCRKECSFWRNKVSE